MLRTRTETFFIYPVRSFAHRYALPEALEPQRNNHERPKHPSNYQTTKSIASGSERPGKKLATRHKRGGHKSVRKFAGENRIYIFWNMTHASRSKNCNYFHRISLPMKSDLFYGRKRVNKRVSEKPPECTNGTMVVAIDKRTRPPVRAYYISRTPQLLRCYFEVNRCKWHKCRCFRVSLHRVSGWINYYHACFFFKTLLKLVFAAFFFFFASKTQKAIKTKN